MNVLQDVITNRTRGKGNFQDARVFVYTNTYKQGFAINSKFTQANQVNVKLQKGRKHAYDSTLFDLTREHLPMKYPTPIKLNEKKIEDLLGILPFITRSPHSIHE